MPGIEPFDYTTYYWVWSPHGSADDGISFDRRFLDGMIPCPVSGEDAERFEIYGYCVERYEPGTWFSHWDTDRKRPIFAPVGTQPQEGLPRLTLTSLPERLPDEYVELLEKYTKGGKLRRNQTSKHPEQHGC